MQYTIAHKYQPEMFVPAYAISDNINFLVLDKEKRTLLTQDNRECEVLCVNEVNVLSEAGKELIRRIYDCTAITFLERWYQAMDGHVQSLEFIYLKFK